MSTTTSIRGPKRVKRGGGRFTRKGKSFHQVAKLRIVKEDGSRTKSYRRKKGSSCRQDLKKYFRQRVEDWNLYLRR